MITKGCQLEVKELDTKRRYVEAYFSSFGTVDSDNDIIQQGAARKSIMENGPKGKGRIKHLFNHWDAVGRFDLLQEDTIGIKGGVTIGRHRLGDDVLAMYEDGIITEHSFGFEIIKAETGNRDGVRVITELRMWEGSSLDKWGANENTPVIKSLDDYNRWSEVWLKRYDSLTKALTNRTNYTDETYEGFIVQIKSLESAFRIALEAVKPLASTSQPIEPLEKKGIDWQKIINTIN